MNPVQMNTQIWFDSNQSRRKLDLIFRNSLPASIIQYQDGTICSVFAMLFFPHYQPIYPSGPPESLFLTLQTSCYQPNIPAPSL